MLPGAFTNCTPFLRNRCINSGFLKTPTRNIADIKTAEYTTTLDTSIPCLIYLLPTTVYCTLCYRDYESEKFLTAALWVKPKPQERTWREDNCFFPKKRWAWYSLPKWRVGWAVGKRGRKQGADWEAHKRKRSPVCDRGAGLMPNLGGTCWA